MTLQHRLAGAAQSAAMGLQARADLELIRNVVSAETARVRAAGAVLGTAFVWRLRQRRTRDETCGKDERYAANHDQILVEGINGGEFLQATGKRNGPKLDSL